MHKDIIFLEGVKQSTRQNILKFVKNWNSKFETISVTTSGSTGKPKLIELSKSQMKASALATISFFNLSSDQTILLALSIDYIAGKMMLIRALEKNMTIIVAPLQSNPLLLNLTHKIHFSAFVPMQVQTILNNKISKKNYELIDTVIIGGGVINETLENQLSSLNNHNYATFGMTETISHIGLRNISKQEKHYTALPNITFKVNATNCLVINAPLINSTINLQTTDVVELLNSKQFIWKGRADFVINSGGIKLHPEFLEKKIEHILPDNRFYFIGVKDDVLGEKLVLNIESQSPLDSKNIMLLLKKILDKFEQPKLIVIIAKFTETKTGKVKRV